jgi:hypothetical protein
MRREVRTEAGQDFLLHGIPFLGELMQDLCLRIDIVEDHTVGNKVAILTDRCILNLILSVC